MSNSSDPDLDRQNVGPDLGPYWLHRLSAEDESFHVKLSSVVFFSKLTFSKKSFRNTIRMSNGLDLDQDRRSADDNRKHGCYLMIENSFSA